MICEALYKKRKEKGMTRKELARAVGVSEAIIRNWENGVTAIPTEYLWPLCRVFRCSPTAFIYLDNKSFKWYTDNYNLPKGIEEFFTANPDLMNMVLWMVNEWDGNFEMLTLMAYYYCNLSKYERSHISYITGAMYNLKYNNIPKTPMQDLAYRRLKEYFGEWHKLIGHEIKKPLEDEIEWAIDGKKGQAQYGKTKPRENGEVNSK
nr:MAG TPA: helix-turn-helix XRE-family like protein [Caudoviricetes sp.]